MTDHASAPEPTDGGYDFTNTYTTQEGDVFGMEGATCPRCPAASKLSHREPVSGYFNCPSCGVMYDEPNFDPMEFVTNVDDGEGPAHR